MDTDTDPSVDEFLDLMATSVGLVVIAGLIVWLIIALIAYLVAPADRPWSFFWCTFLLLGPLGVAVALLAQPRRYGDG